MLYEAEGGDIRMAITGDTIISLGMSMYREERFLKVAEMLRNADIAFTNAEMAFNNYEDPPSLKTAGGGNLRGDPRLITDLKWLGIDMVALANNHAYDFGENGVLTTMRYMDESGMPHAGLGSNLSEGRAPVYVDTPKGRVALISATSSGPQWMIGADQWRHGLGRPGANMVRSITRHTVDRAAFDVLRRLSKWLTSKGDNMTLSMLGRRLPMPGEEDVLADTETQFFLPDLHPWSQYPQPNGVMIALGEQFETQLIPYKTDLDGNIERIREARRQADWVIVTMHDHDDGKTPDDPSDIAVVLGRAAIDAGADVFAVHGPHRDRGIEIYKGKPIFYSVAHLVFQSEAIARMPLENMLRVGLGAEHSVADFYDQGSREDLGEWTGLAADDFRWRNAFAIVDFKAKALKEIRLYPLDLGFKRPRSQRGRPLLAEGQVAQDVLELFQRLSAPLGTKLEIEGGVGIIRGA